MLHKTSVEKLTLWNNHFGKEHNNALRTILLLTKGSSVKFLDLGHNYIGYMNQGDISSIFSIFKNLNITHINLSNNHLGRLDVSDLLILLDLLTIGTKITHIDISSNALCEMNCALLRNFDFSLKYATRSLHYLNLSHTGLYNRGIHYAILDWISNSNVEHLDLSHSGLWQFTTENLHRLFKKLEKTNVSNLNISDNKLCYTGSSANLKAILQALNNSQVYKINLSGNNLLLIKPGFLIEIFQQIPSNKYYHFTFDIQDMNQYGVSALYKLLSERLEQNQFIFEMSFSFNRSNPKHNILFELHKALRYEFMYSAGDISQDDFAKALHYINILQILRNMEDELLFHHYFPNITHHITYTSHEHIEDYATSDNDQYLRLSMLKTLRSNGQIPHGLKTQYANKFHETIGDILHNTRYDKESKQLMMSEILSFI